MTPPKLIGLGYRKQVGKSTTAAVLVKHHGYQEISFAAKLKHIALTVDPYMPLDMGAVPLSELISAVGWEGAKEYHREVRQFLQDLGLVMREEVGENVWVDAAFKDYKSTAKTVISDVRFQNEARKIKELGGVVVCIERAGVPFDDQHPSEVDLKDWPFDAVFSNNDPLEDIVENVTKAWRTW